MISKALNALRITAFFLFISGPLCSCSMLVSTTILEPTVDNLQKQTDLDLVCEGGAAYLLMIDSLIASDPDSKYLLTVGAQAYSGYLSAMSECGISHDRQKAIAEKARQYGTKSLARLLPIAPGHSEEQLQEALAKLNTSHMKDVFWGTLAWLKWVESQQGAPAALADLVTIEKIMIRLLAINENYQAGSIHLFFGVYYATKPPMLGGDPEKSRFHFQRALELSENRFLLVQASYAQTLARQLFDQQLHDRLLAEVLNFKLDSAPEHVLSNQIAKRKAARLLAEEFFAD